MDSFEYIMVLVSIVIGLGITHILSSIGSAIHRKNYGITGSVEPGLMLQTNWPQYHLHPVDFYRLNTKPYVEPIFVRYLAGSITNRSTYPVTQKMTYLY